jgi:ABC-type transporter Mla maintaining outer membrane lipid asymmetry ATPase subunit MlaF
MGDGIGHVALTGVAIGQLTGAAPIWTAVIVAFLGAVLIEHNRESGSTIVLVAHELGAMAPLVDRAVVMRDGRKAYDGPPLADHEVHHPEFGEPHTHHHHEETGRPARDHAPQVGSPLDGGHR